MLSPFIACLTEQLEKRGYGDKRQAELVDRFNGLREGFVKQGAVDPDTAAMQRVLDEVNAATATKNRLAFQDLLKHAERKQHFDAFNYNNAILGATNEKATPASAAIALLIPDARARTTLGDIVTLQRTYRDQNWGVMNDIPLQMGKGMFGMQKGKAWMDNVVREVFGQATGDEMAAQLGKSWRKGTDAIVDTFNTVGGAMQKLEGWGLPQKQSMAKILKAADNGKTWIADHMNWLDFDKMRWPNGAPIEAADRQRVLEAVYKTMSTDGANKIKPGDFHGQGQAIGNMMDQHRFLAFKDGDAWLAMHQKYGDGNVFDVMASYVDHMSQQMALVRVFGSNPEQGMEATKALAQQRAGEQGGRRVVDNKAALNKYDMLKTQALHQNPMNPESKLATGVNGAVNILTSVQLGSSVFAAVTGDLTSTMVMRAANNMPVVDGLMGPYLKGLFSPREAVRISAEQGYIVDSIIHTAHSSGRFHGFNEFGPAWTKRVSDFFMRASGMNVHTDMLNAANYPHFMGMFGRDADKPLDELPWKPMADKYGITPKMWDNFRALETYKPRENVEFLRPKDILASNMPDKQGTYEAFQNMVLKEMGNMVIMTSPEANVILKGNMRPDTLPGALLHSFAMYKNFSIGMALAYGRVAMSQENRAGRLAFVAGLGTSLILAGGVGMQMREISKGRDPLPVNTPSFWGKALLASGAMSIWGDFLFYGINKMGGPADIAAGPIVGLVGDTTQLALGNVFDWADHVGTLKDKGHKAPFGAKAVEFASRYTPGSHLWYAQAALQREIFDNLRVWSDPRGASNMAHKERQRVKDTGSESWWAPGTSTPQRPPNFEGMVR